MKLRDFADKITIDLAKLTSYALNKNHPRGRHKAVVFEAATGFTSENYELLLQQIERDALQSEALLSHGDAHGQHYRVDMQIVGLNGKEVALRTGWLIPTDSKSAALTTLFILRDKP